MSRSPSTRGTNCSGWPGTTSRWPWKITVGPFSGPTSAVSTCSSPNSWSRTSMSRASSQPLTKPAAERRPSTDEVSYVINRSVRTRSSTGSRVAVGLRLPGPRNGVRRQVRRPADEIERTREVVVVVDGEQVRERRRLGEELERQPVARVVGVHQVAREGQQLAPLLGVHVADPVVLLQPGADLRVAEGRRRRGDAHLAAAQVARG